MRSQALSALPVLGGCGELVGIVSEADLLHKEAPPSEQSRLWPESRERRGARAKSKAASAAEVMTRPVITVAPRATLAAAARLMLENHVKRLPVVDDDGRLIGIVSRRDMLTAFVRSDAEIRRDILEGVLPGWLGVAPDAIAVSVKGGVVTIRGTMDRRSDVETVEHVVASLDGVVGVDADRQRFRRSQHQTVTWRSGPVVDLSAQTYGNAGVSNVRPGEYVDEPAYRR
jgi:CBS-domain-containing membrane protein